LSSQPTLPGGITSVLPRALNRAFLLVQEMKAKPAYALPLGLYMGIVGCEAPALPPRDAVPPRIKVSVIQGANSESARMKFFKDGHTGIHAEVSVNGGA
jgi:hypothetical protein